VVGGGGALRAAGGISLTGGIDCGGSTCTPTAKTGIPPVPDPLAYLPAPAVPTGTVFGDYTYPGTTPATLQPGTYDKITIQKPGHVTFAAGLYILRDVFKIADAGVTIDNAGDGVTFYTTTSKGSITIGSVQSLTLNAPTTGTYRGILLFQDRTDTQDATVSSGTVINLNGTIYMKSAQLSYTGGSGSGAATSFTAFVVNALVFGGGGVFTVKNDFGAPGSRLQKVMLLE